MERATGAEVYGCGSPQSTDITLNIQTTTGGNFSISLNGKNTVEHLKKLVSKKLKVSKDRICLLHRERQLRDGTLEENGLLDGSRVILLPSVETGLLSQRPENSVMQALESLNDTQVNDFLSGKSPLNLTMRLGDNMMLIQLQLSTLNSSSSSASRSLKTTTPTKSSTPAVRTKRDNRESPGPQTADETPPNEETATETEKTKQDRPTVIQRREVDVIPTYDLYQDKKKPELAEDREEMDTTTCTLSDLIDSSIDQSPIKSLSNLVSSPIDASTSDNRDTATTLTNTVKSSLLDMLARNRTEIIPTTSGSCDKSFSSSGSSHTPDSSLSDDSDNFNEQSSFLTENTIDEYPMENLFNSAVDKGLFEDQDESMMDREISNLATTSHGTQDFSGTALPPFHSINEPMKKRFPYMLHKTSKFKHPIAQNKQKAFMQSVVNKHKKRMQIRQDNNLSQPSTSRTEPYITNPRKLILQPSNSHTDDATPSTSKQSTSFKAPDTPKKAHRASPTPPVDTKALIEASKNLTQKLKKLSKEVLTNKIDLRTAEESVRSKIGPGAVIESMKHHGKGIYSGTFSGTLNPALQDRYGRPKRDISTIIHILNDLLCAAPAINLTQKETKSCATSTTEDAGAGKCLGCSQPACPYGQCDGHAASTSAAKDCACDRGDCRCRIDPDVCPSCSAKSTAGELCKKCDSAKALAIENSKTKCKLEQLRLVMQQKKQRREARKLKTLPYSAPRAADADPPAPLHEHIDTLA